jgi:hypothetical protein
VKVAGLATSITGPSACPVTSQQIAANFVLFAVVSVSVAPSVPSATRE